MALSPFPLSSAPSSSSTASLPSVLFSPPASSPRPLYTLLLPGNRSSEASRISCSRQSLQLVAESDNPPTKVPVGTVRKKRKPKPSFLQEVQDKWSLKLDSGRDNFPWQQQQGGGVGEGEVSPQHVREEPEQVQPVRRQLKEVSFDSSDAYSSPPWVVGRNIQRPQLGSGGEKDDVGDDYGEDDDVEVSNSVEKRTLDFGRLNSASPSKKAEAKSRDFGGASNASANGEVLGSDRGGGSVQMPWRREDDGGSKTKSNTELAERIIPEHELKRLRNVALRMLERIKVGEAGITEALVESIREKWRVDEVVKLKFERPHSANMKRTHEMLESRTGGMVIWRSGSSVVLYRGMSYKLPCVQLFNEQTRAIRVEDTRSLEQEADHTPDSAKKAENLSEEELMDIEDLLDELGPRFKDWSGRQPVPVDADRLPSVVPDYKAPFRLLPHGVRHCLRNKEMTNFRRLARTIPPHFALGRSRKLQGLAQAMVKLWERSAVAKIAIKRGVLNTCNDRMAEELKNLTGGTLLSRNKEFIVFYRGNNFLPPAVKDALQERLNLTNLEQKKEEEARELASSSISPNSKDSKGSLFAGTLAETLAATSRWGNDPSSVDVEEMIKDSSLNKHESLLRSLENKLALAMRKFKKAERSIGKLQEDLEPSDLPSDLETISDEERFLFRKMGLSMKPFLLLGRRGMFDGTVENMHLHWKHRELVKLIVRGRSFPQVKHLAISLEAESGGVLISLDKTPKGYAIVMYRGKNYQRPSKMRPRNLLTKRQALARSIELQRREALKHHILDLEEKIDLLKSELEDKRSSGKDDDGNSLSCYDVSDESDYEETDEEEAAYLDVYDSEDDNMNEQNGNPI